MAKRKLRSFDIEDTVTLSDPMVPAQEWHVEDLEGFKNPPTDLHYRMVRACASVDRTLGYLLRDFGAARMSPPEYYREVEKRFFRWEKRWAEATQQEERLADKTSELIDFHVHQPTDGEEGLYEDEYIQAFLQRRWKHFSAAQLKLMEKMLPEIKELEPQLEGYEPFTNFQEAVQNYVKLLKKAKEYFASPGIKDQLPHVHIKGEIPREAVFWHQFSRALQNPMRRSFAHKTGTPLDDDAAAMEPWISRLRETQPEPTGNYMPDSSITQTLEMGWKQTATELREVAAALLKTKLPEEASLGRHTDRQRKAFQDERKACLRRFAAEFQYIDGVVAEGEKEVENQQEQVELLSQCALQARYWYGKLQRSPELTVQDKARLGQPMKEYVALFNAVAPTVLNIKSDMFMHLHMTQIQQNRTLAQQAKEEGRGK